MNYLINMQATKVIEYASREKERQRDPQQFALGLRILQQTQEEYEERLAQRLKESEQMRSIGAEPPRLVGVCALVPPVVTLAEDEDSEDPDIEAIAINTAVAYEHAHGRTPTSVETKGLGYDLRSQGAPAMRYIEVKGRRGTGAISMTANEWIKAARVGSEYWLYVVYNCDSPAPQLMVIQDPAATLQVAEDHVTAARFRVNVGEIHKHATPAERNTNEGA